MKRPFRASQYNRHSTKPNLAVDRASRTDHDFPALNDVQDSFPIESVLQNDGHENPDLPQDQLSLADQETSLLNAILDPASPDILPQSDPFLDRTVTAELATPSPGTVLNPPPAELSPQSDPFIHQAPITDLETTVLKSMPDPLTLDASPQSDPFIHRAPIADQQTSSLNASPEWLVNKNPLQSDSDRDPHQASVADQETSSLNIVRKSSPRKTSLAVDQPHNQASAADQETLMLAALDTLPNPEPDISHKLVSNRVERLRQLLSVGLARLEESQPEGQLTRGLQIVRPDFGLTPLLALTNASGLLMVSLSYYFSIRGYAYPLIEACFSGGLLLIFMPNLIRLLSRIPARVERICLLCVLGLVLYLTNFIRSPLYFSSYDESLHWRTADDILRTGHLFNINSMLPVSPYYPGLELVTNAISTTTGLSTFYAGTIVTAAAHFLMVLALFLFFEHITRSSRMASIGVLIYITNQHFIFFDSSYSYETLALPLALFMIYILTRYANAGKNQRWVVAMAWIVLMAITITHHMTNYVFDGLLLLWAGISFFRPVPQKVRIHLAALAIFAFLLSLTYAFFLPGNPVWSYLSDYFGSAFGQLEQIITGSAHARSLFTSAVNTPPLWD